MYRLVNDVCLDYIALELHCPNSNMPFEIYLEKKWFIILPNILYVIDAYYIYCEFWFLNYFYLFIFVLLILL